MGSQDGSRPGAALGEQVGEGIGRVLGVVFSVFVMGVFVVLWLAIFMAMFGNEAVLADAWAWLSGLGTIEAVVVWIAVLPIAVFLWAWQADLSPLLMGLLMIGFVAWTGAAFSGPLKALFRRRSAAK